MGIFGYVRVSTAKQSLTRQIENILAAFPGAQITAEKFTGTKVTDRPAWSKLFKSLRSGDVIIFDEVSRLARNSSEGFACYQALYARGVDMVFLKQPGINSTVYREAAQRRIEATVTTGNGAVDAFTGKLFDAINGLLMDLARQQITAAFDAAQAEVDFLHKRVAEGMQASGAGKKISERRTGSTYETAKSKRCKADILRLSSSFNGSLSDVDVIRFLGISRGTFYRYKKALLG